MDPDRYIFSAFLILAGVLLVIGESRNILGYLMVFFGIANILLNPMAWFDKQQQDGEETRRD